MPRQRTHLKVVVLLDNNPASFILCNSFSRVDAPTSPEVSRVTCSNCLSKIRSLGSKSGNSQPQFRQRCTEIVRVIRSSR